MSDNNATTEAICETEATWYWLRRALPPPSVARAIDTALGKRLPSARVCTIALSPSGARWVRAQLVTPATGEGR